jgi:AcrR family transcriptional regulator
MARTQEQRRTETRERLLDAAAALFAEQGIDGASIDAIAEAADRTSGSIYAHFGSKDGLLTALLDTWKNEMADLILAEFLAAETFDARLGVLWSSVANPPPEQARWFRLEHELWLYATRDEEARERLARRYRGAWLAIAGAVRQWTAAGDADPPVPERSVGPLVIALLIGLEMQHRIDPQAVSDDVAVAGLRALLGATPEGTE